MTETMVLIAAVLGGGVAAGTAFYVLGRRGERRAAEVAARAAARESERLLEDAKQRLTVAAKEELLRTRETLERELALRRSELDKREGALERRTTACEERERELGRRDQALTSSEQALAGREREARAKLEQLAGLSAQEAKEDLMRRLEDEARSDAAALLRDIKEQAKKTADREAKKIVALAIQRIAAEHTAESTVAAVGLPPAGVKGRIIGGEGADSRGVAARRGGGALVD